jgi:hypothetical protein
MNANFLFIFQKFYKLCSNFKTILLLSRKLNIHKTLRKTNLDSAKNFVSNNCKKLRSTTFLGYRVGP